MKKLLVVSVFIFVAGHLFAQTFDLIGRWSMVGDDNTYAGFEMKTDSLGVFFVDSQDKEIVKFTIDATKSPIWVDMVILDVDEEMLVPALIEFVDENNIKFEMFSGEDEERPAAFSDEADGIVVVLSRETAKKE